MFKYFQGIFLGGTIPTKTYHLGGIPNQPGFQVCGGDGGSEKQTKIHPSKNWMVPAVSYRKNLMAIHLYCKWLAINWMIQNLCIENGCFICNIHWNMIAV